jgi:DNA repair exonuclease SbcCD nuclease subunit
MSQCRVLVVGDPHVVPEELDDCSNLIGLILKVCRSEEIHEIWWMGDQHHTHSILRLEVLHWWRNAFKALKNEGINSICLIGNHDQAFPGSPIHSMLAYEGLPGVKFIDKPTEYRGVLFVPYIHDQAEFLGAVNRFSHVVENDREDTKVIVGPKTLVCHQTFDGSTYENGFPATDGFDPNLVSQELIISGHIHTGQEYGKVWYVGAPRWRSLSDANVERAIWVLDFDNGQLTNRKPYSTGDVCRQIRHVEDTASKPIQLPLDPAHQWRIDIKGSPDWCRQRKTQLQAAGARIRTFPTQVSLAGKVRESEGVENAFKSYLKVFQSKYGTSTDVLATMAKERLHV